MKKERFESLSLDRQVNFFISYRWNETSKKEVENICKQLVLYKINPVRDIYSLKYGNSITSYMNSVNNCDGVVLIICDEYFFSVNCMYEGITAMLRCKNRTLIRMIEKSIFSIEFKKKIAEFWDDLKTARMFENEKEKFEMVKEHYQEFIFWISDTNSVSPEDTKQFVKELKKHVAKVFLETFNYLNMVEDLVASKRIVISKVCDPTCEEYYYYKNINYSIQDSPVNYFKCFYNFVISLEKCNTNELLNISINNVVGIEEGNSGINFSKYYFVIPRQEALDKLAFEEKLGKEKSEIEYDKRRIIIDFR